MEYAFASHLLLWLIGAMVAVGFVLTVLGFWSLGRSGYRKD
jgi:cytochrome oxidase assembly protein ShyY1